MKRLVFAVLISCVLLSLAFVWKEQILTVKASPDVFQGNLILNGNNVTTIEGTFDINGSIIVEENATLALKNAVVNFTQASSRQFNMTFRNPANGNPRLIVSNATLKSNYGFYVYFYGNSTAFTDGLRVYEYVYFYDTSFAVVMNSPSILFLWCYQSSNVQISGSQFVQMRCHDSSAISISNSSIANFVEVYDSSNTSISNCTIKGFGIYGSSVTTISDSTIEYTYFQGGSSSILALYDSEIGFFRDWGSGKISVSNCTTNSFEVMGSSHVFLSNCLNYGEMRLNYSSIISISNQLLANGSIVVEENATLVLENAVLNFTQTEDWLHGIILRNAANGYPSLQVSNTTITSNYKYSIKLYQNSSAAIYDSQFTALSGQYCWLWTYDSAVASCHNLTVRGLSCASTSSVSIFNSTMTSLNTYGSSTASVYDSDIYSARSYGTSAISMGESAMSYVYGFESSVQNISDSIIDWIYAHNETSVWLINSTYTASLISGESKIFVLWYLDVHVVDSIGQDVPSANVSATYPNSTIAESKLTDTSGWSRLILLEKMKNATADYPIGNYTVTAVYETYSDQETVNMTENKQLTLTLEELVIPEFPSFLILSSFMIATLIAVIFHEIRQTKQWTA